MSWKLIDRPKTQKVTKALAKQYAEMEPAPHDRPLSERRLQVYSRLLEAGQFRPVTWACVMCKETGGLYRVNGKHTSVLLSGMDKLPEFYAVVEEYECDTLEDVAKLYGTFDSAMQQRSARDIYLSFAATVDDLKEVPVRVIGVCPSAIAFALNIAKGDKSAYLMTPPERAELLLEYPGFVVWAATIMSESKGKHLIKLPVTAAMFSCYQKTMKPTNDFWCAVRDESGQTPDLPDRKLSRYLLTTGLRRDSRTIKTATTNREVYVKCLHAWNAWRKSEKTSLAYYADAKVPALI